LIERKLEGGKMKNFILINEVLVFIISLSGFSFMEKHIEPADTIRYLDKGNIYEYEIVEEIDIGEDVYKVLFGEDSEYPLFVYIRGKVGKSGILKFYDNNFNEIEAVEASRAFTSSKAEYVGIYIGLKSPTRTEEGKMKFILLDEKGDQIWEKENVLYYDSPGYDYFISDKGRVVEFNILNGILNFYNEEGNKIKEIKLFKESYWEVADRNIWGKFSGDGNYFAINATNLGGETFTNGSGVILYNRNGEELWNFDCDEEWGDAIDISSDGRYVISANNSDTHQKNATYLFNRDGRLLRKYDKICGSIIAFSKSGKYVVFSGAYIFLVETKTGDILFKYSLLGKGIRVKDVNIAEVGKLMGVIFSNRVELIQFNGIKAWSKEIPNLENIWLNNEGDKLTVRSKNKSLRFEKVEGE
jgi:hypothetical protein